MWVDAGFSPDAFWHQSPATFQVAMSGVRKRMEREAEQRLSQSWEIAALSGAAQAGKLKPLRHYLRPVKQSPSEMLAVLRSIASNPKNGMDIRKLH